jgi:hypothetical protein
VLVDADRLSPANVRAAIQAASLAGDYGLAIALARHHDLLDKICIGCTCDGPTDGIGWEVDGTNSAIFRTCGDCSETFARWYTTPSPARDRAWPDLAKKRR